MSDSEVLDALTALDKLEKTPGRKRKLRLELLNPPTPMPVLKEIFRYAFDWRLSFPTLPVIEAKKNAQVRSPSHNWDEFEKIVAILSRRSLSGSQSRQIVRNFFECTSPLETKWYLRCLQRDLHCGVSLRILSKVWAEFNLRFGYMRPSQGHELLTEVPKRLASMPLIDGQRVLFVVYQGCATAYTDGFRQVPILDALGCELVRADAGDYVLDGILTTPQWSDSERLLHSKLKSISALELKQFAARLKFVVNDQCSIDIFNGSIAKDETPYSTRRINLEMICHQVKNKNPKTALRLGRMHVVRNTRDLAQAYYHAEHMGYAGLSFQDFDGPYVAAATPAIWATHFNQKQSRRSKR